MDYFLFHGESSYLAFTRKVRYDRIKTKDEFLDLLKAALDYSQIPPEIKNELDFDKECLLDGVFDQETNYCLTEEEWCQYDPSCMPNNPFQEPPSSLKSGIIAGLVILLVSAVAGGLYLLHQKILNDQAKRYKRHFARRIAETIHLEGSVQIEALTPEELAVEFQRIDVSSDGLVSKDELWEFLQTGKVGKISEKDFNALFESIDKSGDGQVDFLEFCAFLGKCNSEVTGFADIRGGKHHGPVDRKKLAETASRAILNRVHEESSRREDDELFKPLREQSLRTQEYV